jgi:hypothetical protein
MSSKRLFYTLVGLNVAVVLAIVGGAFAINKLLGAASKTIVSQRLKIQTLDAESDALGSAKKDIKQYSQLAGIAQGIVPQDKDQAQAVREIVNIAADNGIKLASISFPSSSLGTTPGASALSTSQLLLVKGIPGVYSLQISVQSDPAHSIPYNQMLDFLKGLENNRRTALVSDITITPDSKNSSNVSFNLTLDEYIKP